ncbi:hypothetical protein AVEN_103048-1 [Araneus ventricosus]|uniref:Uncharacterized protein n=1 Tax=Araneus ventricosus TaxID=182803 RepID=A0A4Y2BAE9_ARAVE|nr:hypothetical protein AVEN_103048-1 [Araneus ventricosus]
MCFEATRAPFWATLFLITIRLRRQDPSQCSFYRFHHHTSGRIIDYGQHTMQHICGICRIFDGILDYPLLKRAQLSGNVHSRKNSIGLSIAPEVY